VPDEFRAESIPPAMQRRGPVIGARILLPRADIGRDVIADRLRSAGAIVSEVIAYRTVLDESPRDDETDVYRMLLEDRIDVVTFTSASAVKNFARIFGEDQTADLLRHTAVAAIGPQTTQAAAELGVGVTIQPSSYTIPALTEAIAAHFWARAAAG
jgi:uroporphyrinogen-III synthase